MCTNSNISFVLSLFFVFLGLGCSTSTPVKGPDKGAELEFPDEVIPWKRAGSVEVENISEPKFVQSRSKVDLIDFQKVIFDYPAATNLKLQIEAIEFFGPHEEIWAKWNEQVTEAVNRIRMDLRRQPNLVEYIRADKRNTRGSRIIDFKVNRIEIQPRENGYVLNFTSETPGVADQVVELMGE